ncbi:MAG: serine/threonine-protein kinase [Myxococcota bacterium]
MLPTSAAIAVTELFAGTPYRMVRPLAVGGMAEVYLVAHRGMGRQFVAKVPRGELIANPQIVDRMRVEAQATGRLNHPHILSAAGFGTTSDGRPYIVTEYLQGRTLTAELAERGRLPIAEALQYSCELLSALVAAHALGIVHRDIKPDNLFVCQNPDGSRFIKVLDFGIARVLPDAPEAAPRPLSDTTATGVLIGTPRWLSPEAAMGGRVDHRGDVYSAGLVIYLLVAGRGPFDHIRGDDMLLTAHAIEDAERASKLSEAPLPPELDALLAKALQKEPTERFQTAEEFLKRIESIRAVLLHSPRLLETSVYKPFGAVAEEEHDSSSSASGERSLAIAPPSARSLSAPVAMAVFLLAVSAAAALGSVVVSLISGSWP